MRSSGFRSRVADRTVTTQRTRNFAAAVFLVSCDATQAQLGLVVRVVNHISTTTQDQAGLVVRVVNHNSSCTQAQSADCVITFVPTNPASAGGGGGFTVIASNPFKNPFHPRVTKR